MEKELRSLKIDSDGRIYITGIRDTMYAEGEQQPDGTWQFDGTRLILQAKCRDTSEVFTRVNAWSEETGEAVIAVDASDRPPLSDPDWPYVRVQNCVKSGLALALTT